MINKTTNNLQKTIVKSADGLYHMVSTVLLQMEHNGGNIETMSFAHGVAGNEDAAHPETCNRCDLQERSETLYQAYTTHLSMCEDIGESVKLHSKAGE